MVESFSPREETQVPGSFHSELPGSLSTFPLSVLFSEWAGDFSSLFSIALQGSCLTLVSLCFSLFSFIYFFSTRLFLLFFFFLHIHYRRFLWFLNWGLVCTIPITYSSFITHLFSLYIWTKAFFTATVHNNLSSLAKPPATTNFTSESNL